MLVLARKVTQKVVLRHRITGEIIKVQVAKMNSAGQVRLGFEAGPNWEILREELVDAPH